MGAPVPRRAFLAMAAGAACALLAGCAGGDLAAAPRAAGTERDEGAAGSASRTAAGVAAPEGQPAGPAGARLEPARAVLSVDYSPTATHASNQMAAWVEREGGSLLKTLFVTDFTASRRGYRERADALRRWVTLADPEAMDDSEVDAVSSATPAGGRLSFEWDFTDADGERVQDGTYKLALEATLFWSSSVRYEATIEVGGVKPGPVPVEETRSEPGDETNAAMVGNVSVVVEYKRAAVRGQAAGQVAF